MTYDPISLWWESITGPVRLVEQITTTISDGKSVILRTDDALCWREQLPDLVAHRIPAAQINPLRWYGGGKNDVVPRILGEVRRRDLDRCPPQYQGQLTYLKNEGVLNRCIVWISSDGADTESLMRFASDYRGKSLEEDGAIVVEVPTFQPVPQLSSSVEVISCADYITSADIRLFATILANADTSIPSSLKSYAASAAHHLAGMDAELVPEILERIDFTCEDPGVAFLRLCQEGIFGPSQGMPVEEQVTQRVWIAQLRSAFSGIEMERVSIISRYHDELAKALCTQYYHPKVGQAKEELGFIEQWGERPESPYDLELSTLFRMSNLRRADDHSQYLFYLNDPDLQKHIRFLRDCRNKLAHHVVCHPEEMCRLLGVLSGE